MPEFVHRSTLPHPAGEVFAWHARPGAFERLAPPWERVRVLERKGGIEEGGRLLFEVRKGPVRLRWEARHGTCQEGRLFVDEQVRGPFASWRHEHHFLPVGPGACALEDRVRYRLPFGVLGRIAGGAAARRSLERMFRFRHRRLGDDLARHGGGDGRRPLRVAITGASGLVGRQLTAFLATGGHRVIPLVRRAPRDDREEIPWDPARGALDPRHLAGLDAVVHLAGESVGARWTPARKSAIRRSRVAGTTLLARALAAASPRPRVLVCASATGFYGDRGDELLDESSGPGSGFLPDVCREWEAAADPAREAGLRVVHLRIGIVLSPQGGALERMLLPFRLGLGGRLGHGRQYMSWIALDDLVGVAHRVLTDAAVEGPVNAVAPEPVTNLEFTRTLARVLRRPALFPAPGIALRLALGEMGQVLLLEGARVRPARLEACGFSFLAPTLEVALRRELGLDPHRSARMRPRGGGRSR